MNKILQYQSILQNPRSISIQSVELFSARMYRLIRGGHVIFQDNLEAFASKKLFIDGPTAEKS